MGQLAKRTAGSAAANWTTSSGGVISAVPGATLTTNSAERVTKYVPTSGAATTFAYTAIGSRASATTATTPTTLTTFSYNAASNLVSATAGSTTTSYAADGDGLRQSVTRGSTTSKFLWGTASNLPLLLTDETYSYIYGPDSSPVEAINTSSGAAAYLHEDVIGSVRLATSTAGAVTAVNEFDAYGALLAHSGTNFAIGYSGNWTDTTTKLVYLRARDYDPTTGQFLQVDPAVDLTRQPYAYAGNDPLARTDPSGLCVGLSDSPPDRPCTANDYFWSAGSAEADVGKRRRKLRQHGIRDRRHHHVQPDRMAVRGIELDRSLAPCPRTQHRVLHPHQRVPHFRIHLGRSRPWTHRRSKHCHESGQRRRRHGVEGAHRFNSSSALVGVVSEPSLR